MKVSIYLSSLCMCLAILRSEWKILSLGEKTSTVCSLSGGYCTPYLWSAALICDSLSALAPAFCSVGLSVCLVVVGRGGYRESARWCFCLNNCLAATTKSQWTAGRSLGEDAGCDMERSSGYHYSKNMWESFKNVTLTLDLSSLYSLICSMESQWGGFKLSYRKHVDTVILCYSERSWLTGTMILSVQTSCCRVVFVL